MTVYETRTMAVCVAPVDELGTLYETRIEIIDDGGEYIQVSQECDKLGAITINPDEWPVIRDAIEAMVAQCRG